MMQSCWLVDPSARPTMQQLASLLATLAFSDATNESSHTDDHDNNDDDNDDDDSSNDDEEERK